MSEGPPRAPLGIYDHEDETPGVTSYALPAGTASSYLYAGTRFLEKLDDLAGDLTGWFALP